MQTTFHPPHDKRLPMKKQKTISFIAVLSLFLGSTGTAYAHIANNVDYSSINSSIEPTWTLIEKGDNYLLFSMDKLPTDFAKHSTNLSFRSIGQTYPQFPGGKVCGETFIYRKDADSLLKQFLNTNGSDLVARYGLSQATAAVIRAISSSNLLGAVASILGFAISSAKEKTDAWWGQQLLSVATGKKTYIRKQTICNYGGGYPAAWTKIDVY